MQVLKLHITKTLSLKLPLDPPGGACVSQKAPLEKSSSLTEEHFIHMVRKPLTAQTQLNPKN